MEEKKIASLKKIDQVIDDHCRVSKKPFYLFDEDALEQRIERVRSLVGERADLCYAMKSNPFLVKRAAELLDRIEVCSYGEYLICKKNQLAPGKLLISGVLKKEEEFREILESCGPESLYTVESRRQFAILREMAGKLKKTLHFFIRLTSGNQFGLDEEELAELAKEAKEDPFLHMRGIHFFSGTMKRKASIYQKELQRLGLLAARLEEETGIEVEEIEYGPGIPAAYFQGQENRDEEFFSALVRSADHFIGKAKLTLEMGRAFAFSCGYYASRILDQKKNEEIAYCLLDGGIHHINYDGQIRGMFLPEIRLLADKGRDAREGLEKEEKWTICGSLCTINDILVHGLPLDRPQIGDWLIFQKAGAYSFVEGMALFLSHELPDIMGYSERDGLRYWRKDIETWELNCQ